MGIAFRHDTVGMVSTGSRKVASLFRPRMFGFFKRSQGVHVEMDLDDEISRLWAFL